MPIGYYSWLDRKIFEAIDWSVYDESSSLGYVLEVDLSYPKELHLAHNSLPLAPHRMDITQDDISPFSQQCLRQIRCTAKHKSQKLVSTFLPRKNYVIHAANLALYLQLGMKLEYIHRVVEFKQSNFLEQYITYCTDKRAEAKSTFRKEVFKRMSNANYGKFIENKRKHLNCVICRTKEEFERCVESPRYSNYKVLSSSGIVAVFQRPKRILMSQAWAIGFTILERSKGLIYNDYYNRIRPALNNNCSVVLTDTDSLCLRVVSEWTKDEVLDKLSDLMDYSNYEKSHRRYSTDRANRPKFWKDELKGKTMLEVVGLSSKSYCYRTEDSGGNLATEARCKGVARGVRKKIPFEEYKKCVDSISSFRAVQHRIGSIDHIIRVFRTQRLCFSSFDDKRWIFDCGIHTAPYGSDMINASKVLGCCPFCKYWY